MHMALYSQRPFTRLCLVRPRKCEDKGRVTPSRTSTVGPCSLCDAVVSIPDQVDGSLSRAPSAEERKDNAERTGESSLESRHSVHGTASPAQAMMATSKMVEVVSRSLAPFIPLPKEEAG